MKILIFIVCQFIISTALLSQDRYKAFSLEISKGRYDIAEDAGYGKTIYFDKYPDFKLGFKKGIIANNKLRLVTNFGFSKVSTNYDDRIYQNHYLFNAGLEYDLLRFGYFSITGASQVAYTFIDNHFLVVTGEYCCEYFFEDYLGNAFLKNDISIRFVSPDSKWAFQVKTPPLLIYEEIEIGKEVSFQLDITIPKKETKNED